MFVVSMNHRNRDSVFAREQVSTLQKKVTRNSVHQYL